MLKVRKEANNIQDKMVACLALFLPVVRCAVQCRSPRPTAASHDPFPVQQSFGQRQGQQRPLSEAEDTCVLYQRNLERASTRVLRRHSAVVYIDDTNCTVTKVRRKYGTVGTKGQTYSDKYIDGYWSALFSGLPHFTTLFASHDLPECEALVFANEVDDGYEADWTLPWSSVKAQLEAITKVVVKHNAIPQDASASQIMAIGRELTIIDYEQWRKVVPDPRHEPSEPVTPDGRVNQHYYSPRCGHTCRLEMREAALQDQTGALGKLEVSVWLHWLKNGPQLRAVGIPRDIGLKLVGGIEATTSLIKHEGAWVGSILRPLRFEKLGSGIHCTLKNHMFRWLIQRKTVRVGCIGNSIGDSKATMEPPATLGLPTYMVSSVVTAVKQMGLSGLEFAGVTAVEQNVDVAALLALDVIVFQVLVSETEPTDHAKWGGEVLRQLAESTASTKPAVVAIFVWNGGSTWPGSTWSPWFQQLLQLALQYRSQGSVDISLLGTWFDITASSHFHLPATALRHLPIPRAGINVSASDNSSTPAAMLKTSAVLQLHFSSQLLSSPPGCAGPAAAGMADTHLDSS